MNLFILSLFKIVMLLLLFSPPIIRVVLGNHSHPTQGKNIICSFPNWAIWRTKSAGAGQYTVDNIDPKLCTHILYEFAILDKTTLTISIKDHAVDIDNKGYEKSVALKTPNPLLKVMISLGGWTDVNDGTDKYAQLSANTTTIDTFVSSVMNFLQLYKFDGLDLDYDYLQNAVVKTRFSLLLAALRTAFKTKDYLLSVALPGAPSTHSPSIGGEYDVPSLNENVDFVNLRTFFYHGSWEPTVADHHSPLRKRPWETNNLNAEYAVSYWTDLGLPASKINLGVPLFGLSWILSQSLSSNNNVPPTSAAGVGPAGDLTDGPGKMAFYEICAAVRNKGWKVFTDPDQRIGPYAVSLNEPKTWVGYDDPAMAIIKSQFILSKGLGGAFLFDISYDDFRNTCGLGFNPITTAVYNTLNGIDTTVVDDGGDPESYCECVCK